MLTSLRAFLCKLADLLRYVIAYYRGHRTGPTGCALCPPALKKPDPLPLFADLADEPGLPVLVDPQSMLRGAMAGWALPRPATHGPKSLAKSIVLGPIRSHIRLHEHREASGPEAQSFHRQGKPHVPRRAHTGDR